MDNSELKRLLEKYVAGECTDAERAVVEAWYNKPGKEQRAVLPEADITADVEAIRRKLPRKTVNRIPSWWPYAAAVLVVATISIWLFMGRQAIDQQTEAVHVQDIQPGGNRATLTLADGSQIALSEMQTGIVVREGVTYLDGSTVSARRHQRMDTLSLATPKGGTYQITLPDGTGVWLNAASSLRYPTKFTGNVREVELVGEGYFEVAADEQRPFVVKSAGQIVEVLGTKFNINAYENEEATATTVVHGAVRVTDTSNPDDRRVLKPSEQAVTGNGHIDVKAVDVSYYIGWKDGKFTFDRVALSTVLRQIERWYDVSFEHPQNIPDIPMWGTLSREVMLSELLDVLELNTGYEFKREGRRVMMSQ
ncbi:FecR family protein [Parapedobacter tibetensis]|uniref:FecR family protein n=1 Tax=Parapedobacter tibetensis TaxID=2972951 RepID=UPI00214DBC96|nr:FecR family protein [Parapedobacter tibetensis]